MDRRHEPGQAVDDPPPHCLADLRGQPGQLLDEVPLEGAVGLDRLGEEVIVADHAPAHLLRPGDRLDGGNPPSGDLGRFVPFPPGGAGADQMSERIHKAVASVLLHVERPAGQPDVIDRPMHPLLHHSNPALFAPLV